MPHRNHREPIVALLVAAGTLLVTACIGTSPTGVDSRSPGPISAALPPGFSGAIRIGVVASAPSIAIGSAHAFVLRDKATHEQILSGVNGDVTVSLESSSNIQTTYRLQTACAADAAARDAFVALATAQGYVTYVEFVPSASCWRLLIGSLPQSSTTAQRDAFRAEVIAKGLADATSFFRLVTVVQGHPQFRVVRGTESRVVAGPIVLESVNGIVRIAGATYRGLAEVGVNSAGTLAGINEVPIELYLYGVVPRELPPNPFGEPEALKAQAVAARTYALSNLGKRASDGYDLLPTTSDQVYGGLAAEQTLSSAAVDATRGVVATSGGRLISALYSSTSGGWTANNEDVFSSTPVSYLRGVRDPQPGKPAADLPTFEEFKSYPRPTLLREGTTFETPQFRYHRWYADWTAAEIMAVVSASVGRPVGRVRAINVLERATLGRVLRIEYVTENGTFFAAKDAIRGSLKYIDRNGAQQSLLSTLFFIEPVTDVSTGEVTGFRAYGGGWGHGVGMSQTGAVGLAQHGKTYEEILRFYYHGISLERWE